jgi:hypothetical protein
MARSELSFDQKAELVLESYRKALGQGMLRCSGGELASP